MGGQWVNQKWVPNKHSFMQRKKKASTFDLNAWLKESSLYFFFLVAFTVSAFGGRPTMLLVSYERLWRDTATKNIVLAT